MQGGKEALSRSNEGGAPKRAVALSLMLASSGCHLLLGYDEPNETEGTPGSGGSPSAWDAPPGSHPSGGPGGGGRGGNPTGGTGGGGGGDPITSCASTGIVAPTPPHAVIGTPTIAPGAGVCEAANGEALFNMVANDPSCTTIVLTSTDYHSSSQSSTPYLRVQRPVQIWGRGVAQTRLHFGIELRPSIGVVGASNSTIRGLTMMVDDGHAVGHNNPTSWAQTSAITFWEPPNDTGHLEGITIEDVRIFGAEQVDSGINALAPRRALLRRVEVRNVRLFGINLRNNRVAPVEAAKRPLLLDIVVHNVKDPNCSLWKVTANCPNPGTHQFGLWIGASHTFLRRAVVRDVFSAGIATGRTFDGKAAAADGTLYGVTGLYLTDLDVDRIGVDDDGVDPGRGAGTGISIQRIMRDSIIRQFCIGPDTERGVNAEWNHNDVGSGTFRVSRGYVESKYFGVGFDAGTFGAYVDDLYVTKAEWSALAFHDNWEGFQQGLPSQSNTTAWDSIALGPGVTACTPEASYPASAPCTCEVSHSFYSPSGARYCELP